jgi:hypothetical protein
MSQQLRHKLEDRPIPMLVLVDTEWKLEVIVRVGGITPSNYIRSENERKLREAKAWLAGSR